jgi:CDP-diacylglycerol pyrophosphatase
VTGIEDTHLWVLDGPNYWQYAYENRHYVTDLLKPPKAAWIGFAANSVYGRSQDQLHIHIGCVQPEVIQVLSRHLDELSETQWTWLPRMLNRNYQYRALLLEQKALQATDPFRVLAADVAPDGSMLRHTLFMTAVTLPNGQPGFVLLGTQADDDVRHGRGKEGSNWGSAAELLDLACTADHSAATPVSK